MAKANPKAWFTHSVARITYRKIDKWSLARKFSQPFFPTWAEAHGWMLTRARDQVARLERDLTSARRHLAKVTAMTDPTHQIESNE